MTYRNALAMLADPTRRSIFERVAERPRSVSEIADGLPVSRPAVSQHLKILREADLVSVEQRGTRNIYSARPEALSELREYLDSLWSDVLGAYAERGEDER